MKKALSLAFVMLIASLSWSESEEVEIGKESIEPLNYSKFSLASEYSSLRRQKNFADVGPTSELPNQFAFALLFEAPLYKFMNAGGIFSVNIPPTLTHPIHLRLALFAKPFIPMGERFSLFARAGGGIGAMFAGIAVGGGVHALTNVGIEYFPFSRLGIAVEYGVRAELMRASLLDLGKDKEQGDAKYLISYEMPLTLSINLVL